MSGNLLPSLGYSFTTDTSRDCWESLTLQKSPDEQQSGVSCRGCGRSGALTRKILSPSVPLALGPQACLSKIVNTTRRGLAEGEHMNTKVS